MKKNKAPKVVVMHQHRDLRGQVFGISHPQIFDHKNKKTQGRHLWTIGFDTSCPKCDKSGNMPQ